MEQKYEIDEEILEANRARNRRNEWKRQGKTDRNSFANLGKKYKENKKDGFVITVETLNRMCLDTLIVTMLVTYKWNEDVDWDELRLEVKETIKQWLNGQENWDRKNYIYIWNNPESYSGTYKGKYRSFDFQLYLRRITTPHESWLFTYREVLPLIEELRETVTNVCSRQGIEITRRLPYSKALKDKIIKEEGLAPDAL